VLQGDLPLMEAQAALDAAEAADDGHAHGRAHLALEDAGAFDAKARAQTCMLGWAKLQLDARSTASPAAGACACSWPAR
jgi:hypothetical protein